MPIENQRPQKSPSITPRSSRQWRRRRIRQYCLSFLALAPAAISRPAFAETVTVQISGTLSGVDYLGLFGPAGTNLTNQAFITSFTYDTDDFTAGGESCNNYYISNTPSALITSLTINGHTLSYGNTKNSSSCSNGDPFGATLDFASGSNTISNSAPYGKLYQNFFLSYSTGQLGTLDNPGSAAQGAFLILSIDQGNDTSSDNFEGTAGPTILFNGTAVSTLPNPIPVVVGQPISLMGQPASEEKQPWNASGSPIGGYTVSKTCPKKELKKGDPPPVCAASVDPLNEKGQSIKLYWPVPTEPNATYTVTYEANGGTASAAFSVSGPTQPNIIIDEKNPTQRTVGVLDVKSGQYLGCTPQTCITFAPSATIPPTLNGSFGWIQTLGSDVLTESGQDACNYSTSDSLDNTYPYPFYTKEDGPDGTDDNPDVPLPKNGLTAVNRTFNATMYLTWQADKKQVPGSIPIVLGNVAWNFTASATDMKGWQATPTPLNYSAFNASVQYPIWTTVSVNNDCKENH